MRNEHDHLDIGRHGTIMNFDCITEVDIFHEYWPWTMSLVRVVIRGGIGACLLPPPSSQMNFSQSCFHCVDFSIGMLCIFIVFLQILHPYLSPASGGFDPRPPLPLESAGGLPFPCPLFTSFQQKSGYASVLCCSSIQSMSLALTSRTTSLVLAFTGGPRIIYGGGKVTQMSVLDGITE